MTTDFLQFFLSIFLYSIHSLSSFFLNVVLSSGAVTYSEVRAFLEKDFTVITKYKSLTTIWNETLTLTGNHLIYGRKNCTDKFNPM